MIFFFRVEAINCHLQETSRENECKMDQTGRKVNNIDDRLTRVEEYSLQILDILANLQQPLASPVRNAQDRAADGDSGNVESIGQEDVFPRSAPMRMYSRMMSVPPYVHRQRPGSNSNLRGTPIYFRHKLPNSSPYPPWHLSLSPGNQRQNSVQKAVRKFKRSNTLPSLVEPSHLSSSCSADESLVESRQETTEAIPPAMPLKRAVSESAAQTPG